MLIDSHCHLDRFERNGELSAVLDRAEAAGVRQMVCIGTCIGDWNAYAKLAARHPGRIFWTVGLHPTSVEEDWREQIMAVPSYFATEPLPVALGEIGLDYFHLPKNTEEAEVVVERQKQAFRAQLEIALQMDCPVVIHSRNSFDDCVAMIDASGVDWRKVVFHCFSGNADQIRILNERGGRGSFTGIVTYKSAADVREAAVAQGLDCVMVETDCPYLTPEPHRKEVNEPARVTLTADRLAQELGVTFEEFCKRSTENARAFYGLPGRE